MFTPLLMALTLQLGAGEPQSQANEAPAVVPIEVQFDKSNAVIGEPIVFALTLSAGDAASWTLAPAGSLFTPEQGWIELRRDVRGDRIELTLAALAGGGQSLPPLPLVAKDGSKDLALLRWETAETSEAPFLAVSHALAEGEDALRAVAPLRDVEFGPGGSRFLTVMLIGIGSLLIGLVAIILFLLRRAAKRRASMPLARSAATGLERLAEIEATTDATVARTHAFETTRILRQVIDERGGVERSGATDAEWLAGLGPEWATGEQRSELRELFAEAESVKYGGVTQTTFAQDELLVRARRLAREVSAQADSAAVNSQVGAA